MYGSTSNRDTVEFLLEGTSELYKLLITVYHIVRKQPGRLQQCVLHMAFIFTTPVDAVHKLKSAQLTEQLITEPYKA